MNTSFLGGNAIHKFLGAMVVAILIVGAYISVPHLFTIEKTEAHTHANIIGWAFAQGGGSVEDGVGIGWISMNSDDCDTNSNNFIDVKCGGNDTTTPVEPYGVNVNLGNKAAASGTGDFTGQAYGENIGWISFNRSETGTPPLPPFNVANPLLPIAQVDWATGKVTGWARALSVCVHNAAGVFQAPCVLDLAKAGGWDGWIKLSDDSIALWQNKGVTINNNDTFSGLAWGGHVLGWVNFAPVDPDTGRPIGPVVDDPSVGGTCAATDVPAGNWSTCTAGSTDIAAFCDGTAATASREVPGTQTGRCASPSTGEAVRICSGTGVFCGPDVIGDGTCGSSESFPSEPACSSGGSGPCNGSVCNNVCGPGENPKNSSDCKARWWQF